MNSHPHTRAMRMASDDMAKVIASFKRGPKFMQDPVSPTTQARHDAITNAPPDVQALRGTLTESIIARLARAAQQE